MKERYFQSKYITWLQQATWYLFLLGFGAATALFYFGYSLAEKIGYWGIVLILVSTSTIIVIIGEQFRKTRLFRFWLLCYMLIIILFSVIITKVYFS